MTAHSVVALVPAQNEGDRIASTVAALRAMSGVGEVVVVDDASGDGTAEAASRAGARVLRSSVPLGKGGALERALERLQPAGVYLLVDGDVGASARAAAALLEEVRSGRADMAVGILPRPPSGGFGLVKRTARALIRRISGFEAREPLSGQRAVTAECLAACRPIAPGFGVEIGLTTDAVRMGFRVTELPVAMEHRFTRKDVAGFVHRGRQGLDALRAGLPRALRLR